MFARKHGLERKKRVYTHRKRALVESAEDDDDDEDPLVVREVEEEEELECQTTYRVFIEEDEEDGWNYFKILFKTATLGATKSNKVNEQQLT